MMLGNQKLLHLILEFQKMIFVSKYQICWIYPKVDDPVRISIESAAQEIGS